MQVQKSLENSQFQLLILSPANKDKKKIIIISYLIRLVSCGKVCWNSCKAHLSRPTKVKKWKKKSVLHHPILSNADIDNACTDNVQNIFI